MPYRPRSKFIKDTLDIALAGGPEGRSAFIHLWLMRPLNMSLRVHLAIHILHDMPEADAEIIKLFLDELIRGQTYGRGDTLDLSAAEVA